MWADGRWRASARRWKRGVGDGRHPAWRVFCQVFMQWILASAKAKIEQELAGSGEPWSAMGHDYLC